MRLVLIPVALCTLLWTLACEIDSARALPPLGLTELGDATATFGLSVVQGKAYVSTFAPALSGKYFVVDGDGAVSTITVEHPSLGILRTLSEPVEAVDGDVYFVASSRDLPPTGGALYRINAPDTPVATWDGPYAIRGVDRDLRVYGYSELDPLEFVPNSPRIFRLPTGSFSGNAGVLSVTPSGYIVGDAQEPGTEEFQAAYWDLQRDFHQLFDSRFAIRDRSDGAGINMGLAGPQIKYGDDDPIRLKQKNGDVLPYNRVLPSQTEFAAIDFGGAYNWVYYPGIVPDTPDGALLIEEVFPELDGVDLSEGIDTVFATNGRIYMTFIIDNKAYLFGALDPSLGAVPEPSTLICLAAAAMVAAVGRHRLTSLSQ